MPATRQPTGPEMPPQPGPPPRKRHWVRNTLLALGAVIAAIIVIGVATGGGGSPRSSGTGSPVPADTVSPAPAAQPQAAPVPTVVPVTRVAFVISGQVPAGEFSQVDITYGSDTDQHDRTVPALSGRMRYVVPFDGSAMYYSLDVDFTSAGHVTCKIVVLGPSPDVPTVVAHGSADSAGADSGGLCTAQAAPDDATGESWEAE